MEPVPAWLGAYFCRRAAVTLFFLPTVLISLAAKSICGAHVRD